MGKQQDGMTVGDMAVLAGSVGLVAADRAGQQAFLGWWNQDEKAARTALFARVASRRLAASKAKRPRWLLQKQAVAATARTAGQPFHATSPATVARLNQKDRVAASLETPAPTDAPTEYPASWSRPSRSAAASVRAATAAGGTLVVEPQYPAGWLAATGHAKRTGGVSIVEAQD